MPGLREKRLSFREAAKLIYRVEQPSAAQVERVRQHVVNKELAGDKRGTWGASVAEFLARSAIQQQREARRDMPPVGHRDPRLDVAAVYQETLKSYFVAVLFRRRQRHAGKRFERAVQIGQGALLLGILTLGIFSIRRSFPPLSPERAAVLRWLDKQTSQARIKSWHTPAPDDDGSVRLRVEYHYVTARGKGIDTDRIFVIAGGEVIRVVNRD